MCFVWDVREAGGVVGPADEGNKDVFAERLDPTAIKVCVFDVMFC